MPRVSGGICVAARETAWWCGCECASGRDATRTRAINGRLDESSARSMFGRR